jgi:hypothetical protein
LRTKKYDKVQEHIDKYRNEWKSIKKDKNVRKKKKVFSISQGLELQEEINVL